MHEITNNNMNNVDKQYLDLLREVKESGTKKSDRTGTGTISVFGKTLKFNMKEGFPAITTKKLHLHSIVHELLWFLSGSSNIKYLVDNNVNIWNEWPYKAYMEEHENRMSMLKVSMKNSDYYIGTAFDVDIMKKRLDECPKLTLTEFIKKIKESEYSENFKELGKDHIKTFAEEWGSCGKIYGHQWRNWKGAYSISYDQILKLVNELKTNPDSRRLIVSAFNVAELDDMLLYPCHYAFQCWTRELTIDEKECELEKTNCINDIENDRVLFGHEWEKYIEDQYKSIESSQGIKIKRRALSLMYQIRSNDFFLGAPFNIASYGLLLHMLAQCTNMVPDELITNIGDCHIYLNHIEQAEEQLKREPFALCKLKLKIPEQHTGTEQILNYKYEDFEFIDYKSHPSIKAPIAV